MNEYYLKQINIFLFFGKIFITNLMFILLAEQKNVFESKFKLRSVIKKISSKNTIFRASFQ